MALDGSRKMRDELRVALVSTNPDLAAYADEIADLALHAVDEAASTLFSITARLGNPVAHFVALNLASQLLGGALLKMSEDHRAKMTAAGVRFGPLGGGASGSGA